MDDSQKNDRDVFLPGAIVVAALLIAGALVYNTGSKALPPVNVGSGTQQADLLGIGSAVLGNTDAPVTIVEFGDYQCPYCGKFFTEIEPKIRDLYIKTGKAKMVFRDFPFLGDESDLAAQGAACAGAQGKFWSYHDALYRAEIADGKENSGNITGAFLKSLADQLDLDASRFASCLDSGKYEAKVKKDYDDGVAAGVKGTPTTFVNGKELTGAVPFTDFQAAIEEALAATR